MRLFFFFFFFTIPAFSLSNTAFCILYSTLFYTHRWFSPGLNCQRGCLPGLV